MGGIVPASALLGAAARSDINQRRGKNTFIRRTDRLHRRLLNGGLLTHHETILSQLTSNSLASCALLLNTVLGVGKIGEGLSGFSRLFTFLKANQTFILYRLLEHGLLEGFPGLVCLGFLDDRGVFGHHFLAKVLSFDCRQVNGGHIL